MSVVHPNCVGAPNCHAAFVATRANGLYYTESLVFDDDSQPDWEYVGYIAPGFSPLPIKQFSWDYSVPSNTQVCIDFNEQAYIRYGVYGFWNKIIDVNTVRTVLQAYGYRIQSDEGELYPVKLGWIEYWPNNIIYLTVLCGGIGLEDSGQYFFKSIDAGITWAPKARLYQHDLYCSDVGAIGVSEARSELYPQGAIIFATVHSQFGDSCGVLVSRDAGETWEPFDGKYNPYWLGFVSNIQLPTPSYVYQNSCYLGSYRGVVKKGWSIIRVDGWCTYETSKDPDKTNFSYNTVDSPTYLNTKGGGYSYYCGHNANVTYTHSLESIGNPLWYNKNDKVHSWYAAFHSPNADDWLLIGLNGAKKLMGKQSHVVAVTPNDFTTVYYKAGNDPLKIRLDSGSISYACGGVARKGVVAWDILDPEVPVPPPPPSGVSPGWPIWINCKANELRADPSWDRLYVMTETVWPAGSGLWNQPILFQFLLSGYVGADYIEREGRLAFVPTFAQGQISMYSGDISYAGALEAHVNAPLAHEVLVVGKFAVDDNARFTDDITMATGWLLGDWDIVGTFGAYRVTSVTNNLAIKNDVLITYRDDLATPTTIDVIPWEWSTLKDLPFSVNCQLKEESWIWVGAETYGAASPIMRNTTVSGGAWEARGNGLPLIPINDIERGA